MTKLPPPKHSHRATGLGQQGTKTPKRRKAGRQRENKKGIYNRATSSKAWIFPLNSSNVNLLKKDSHLCGFMVESFYNKIFFRVQYAIKMNLFFYIFLRKRINLFSLQLVIFQHTIEL